jgi:hypothetical protein
MMLSEVAGHDLTYFAWQNIKGNPSDFLIIQHHQHIL